MRPLASRAFWLSVSLGIATRVVSSQQPNPGLAPLGTLRLSEPTVGSPLENTLLVLNLLSERPVDVLIRPLSGEGRDSLLAMALPPAETRRRLRSSGLHLSIWYNSTRPNIDADGFVWQGKGITSSLSGGVTGRAGVLRFAVRPQAFVSQNAAFTPLGGPRPDFRHPVHGDAIDFPYRFGPRAIARIDPGESSARLEYRGFAAGLSSETQHWGPARAFPLMLSAEAGGFPRAFVEARRYVQRVGGLSAQWLAGRLEASPFTSLSPGARSRLATAAVIAVHPAVFKGLSLGGARFFHVRWEPGVADFSTLALPFKGLLTRENPGGAGPNHNQLISAFVRLAPPAAGIETYGEYFREDRNGDLRDFMIQPDHISAYTVGFRRVWRRPDGVASVSIETANSRDTHLKRIRPQGPPYRHGIVSEGHTFRGQLLASSAAFGAGGWAATYERATATQAIIVGADIRRTVQNEEGGNYLGEQTGFYGLRVGKTKEIGSRLLGGFVRLQSGFGHERATNLTLQILSVQ